jgi:hypothetical protein
MKKKAMKKVKSTAGREVWTGGSNGLMRALWSRVVELTSSVEDVALLVLFLGLLAFVVSWFLRIVAGV